MRGIYTMLSLLAILVATGCERRPLEEYEVNYAEVVVEIDWSKTGLNPDEATVIFYSENSSTPRFLYLTGTRGTINLPRGKYSIIAMNDKMEDFDAIEFKGVNSYATIEAFAKLGAIESSSPKTISQVPDPLASTSVDEFFVTEQMIEDTRVSREVDQGRAIGDKKADIVLTPVNVVVGAKLTVHIKNMHLIYQGSQKATIRGFAQSVLLHNQKVSSFPVANTLKLPYGAYYEGNDKHGYMYDNFRVFGFCSPDVSAKSDGNSSNIPIWFLFEATLRDKDMTRYSYERDITNTITIDVNLNINLEVGVDPDNENPPVQIPEVEPIGDGAFQPGVEDWEEVEVPKDMN